MRETRPRMVRRRVKLKNKTRTTTEKKNRCYLILNDRFKTIVTVVSKCWY